MKGRDISKSTSLLSQQAILQRVVSASVTVDKQLVSSIGRGVLVFAAVAPNDTLKEVDAMASKVLKMKLWPDENGANVGDTFPQFEQSNNIVSGNKVWWIYKVKFSACHNSLFWLLLGKVPNRICMELLVEMMPKNYITILLARYKVLIRAIE
jgi:hypothetical protein